MPTISDGAKRLIKVFTSITVVIAAFASFWAVDDRYAKAAEVLRMQESIQETQRAYEKRNLEDKVFELELKIQSNIATPVERTLRDHYSRRLNEIRN